MCKNIKKKSQEIKNKILKKPLTKLELSVTLLIIIFGRQKNNEKISIEHICILLLLLLLYYQKSKCDLLCK